MKKGEKIMKCLKIENNKGFYSINGDDWIIIDKINKDHIMKLVELILDDISIEMDEYDETNLANAAHKIIYSNIWGKLKELENRKTSFKDESERLYKDAMEKYKLE